MGHGVEEVIELVVSWIVSTAMLFAIILGDERDLSEEQLERAWIPSSRTVAIVALSWLALPIHFAKTRGDFRSPRRALLRLYGLVLGLGCTTGSVIVTSLVLDAIFALLGALGVASPAGYR